MMWVWWDMIQLDQQHVFFLFYFVRKLNSWSGKFQIYHRIQTDLAGSFSQTHTNRKQKTSIYIYIYMIYIYIDMIYIYRDRYDTYIYIHIWIWYTYIYICIYYIYIDMLCIYIYNYTLIVLITFWHIDGLLICIIAVDALEFIPTISKWFVTDLNPKKNSITGRRFSRKLGTTSGMNYFEVFVICLLQNIPKTGMQIPGSGCGSPKVFLDPND